MKKAFTALALILITVMVGFLDVLVVPKFPILSVKLPLLIIYVVYILAITKDNFLYIFFVFAYYVYASLFMQNAYLAVFALSLFLIIFKYFDQLFFKNTLWAMILKVVFSVIVFETIYYLTRIGMTNTKIQIVSFLKILSIQAIYSTLFLIAIWPILNPFGKFIEKIFKKNDVLTRYFN